MSSAHSKRDCDRPIGCGMWPVRGTPVTRANFEKDFCIRSERSVCQECLWVRVHSVCTSLAPLKPQKHISTQILPESYAHRITPSFPLVGAPQRYTNPLCGVIQVMRYHTVYYNEAVCTNTTTTCP